MNKTESFRVLSPTAILGYGFPEESFAEGINRNPDLIAVDAGSTDPGPYYLGSGLSFTNRVGVKRDLRLIITSGIKNSIPVVIGTAGGSGAEPHLEWCRQIIREIADEEKLYFKMGIIPADVKKETVRKALKEGRISPLSGVPELTEEDIDESTHLVGQMGVEPVMEAHRLNCDVILCGRAYDPAVFAALPILKGFNPGPAIHMGKILECAAIAASPGSGSDSVMGILKEDSFRLETLSEERHFTAESTAAHSLYEKSDPFHLYGPGGHLDLTGCSFTEDSRGASVSGSRFIPSENYTVKIEGARRVGYRTISVAGTRDPVMIKEIEAILNTVKTRVQKTLTSEKIKGELLFHIYGKNGVMGNLEPEKTVSGHELGLIIEGIGKKQEDADTICSLARSTLLHYGYPGRISTAGNLAFPFSPSDLHGGEVYRFSVYHIMETGPSDLFKVKIEDIGEKTI